MGDVAGTKNHHIPVSVKVEKPYSIDQNLWGRSCECGPLEDPWTAPPEDAYEWTEALADTPNEPDEVEIEFKQGVPVALNGKAMSFVDIILQLNELAGKHGVGRIDHVENRLVGIKSREVYESPAAITLLTAHKELEFLTQPREVSQFKPMIEQKWAQLIYDGLYFSPLKEALDAFIDETQQNVSGTVRASLFKGHCTVTGRKSPKSLYNENLATYTADDTFDHDAAAGFIELWGLPTKVHAQVNRTANETSGDAVKTAHKSAEKAVVAGGEG